MKTIIAIFAILPFTVSAGEIWLGEWLQENEPIVKKYLLNLPESKLGKTIEGVSLTHGKSELEKAVYIENKSDKENGHYIYKFKTIYVDATYENYYMWSSPSFKPIQFPSCNGEWLVPGGFSVLSGDNYTYSSVQPTGQLVVTHCKLAANEAHQSIPKSGAAEL